jgi:hypothetical protein
MSTKVWIAFGRGFLLCTLPLFGAAGTLYWPAAWAFLVLLFGSGLIITRWLAQHDPALL